MKHFVYYVLNAWIAGYPPRCSVFIGFVFIVFVFLYLCVWLFLCPFFDAVFIQKLLYNPLVSDVGGPARVEGPSGGRSQRYPNPLHSPGTEYRAFEAKITAKQTRDACLFPNDARQLSYSMGFLAEGVTTTLFDSGDVGLVELLAFLDTAYEDLDRRGTARRELRELRLGSTDFTVKTGNGQGGKRNNQKDPSTDTMNKVAG